MGATAVQANSGQRYKKTFDLKRMLTHKLLNEAICTDWKILGPLMPIRTATYIRYDAYVKKAVAWDEGGKETKIDLPLEEGWYVPDGNPFAIPNGRKSNADNPNALYLGRYPNISYKGPLGRGFWVRHFNDDGRRNVAAASFRYWRYDVSKYVDLCDAPGLALAAPASLKGLL